MMVKEEEQNHLAVSLGDVTQIYDTCGYKWMMRGYSLCPRCKKEKRKEGCGRYFVAKRIWGIGDE